MRDAKAITIRFPTLTAVLDSHSSILIGLLGSGLYVFPAEGRHGLHLLGVWVTFPVHNTPFDTMGPSELEDKSSDFQLAGVLYDRVDCSHLFRESSHRYYLPLTEALPYNPLTRGRMSLYVTHKAMPLSMCFTQRSS
jgi:hypothetical protein